MEQIYSDYRKLHLVSAFAPLVCGALIAVGMYIAGVFSHEVLRYIAVVALALIFVAALWNAASIVIAPAFLRKQLRALSESEQERLPEEYKNAKQVGTHRYMETCFLFYSNRLIYIFRYQDITAVTKKSKHLRVYSTHRKPVTMPFQAEGANAIAAAFIKSHNQEIKFSVENSN